MTRRAGAKKTRVRAEEGKGALTKQIRISAAQERLNSPTLRDKKESQRVGLAGDADSLISCDEKTRQLCHTVARALYLTPTEVLNQTRKMLTSLANATLPRLDAVILDGPSDRAVIISNISNECI